MALGAALRKAGDARRGDAGVRARRGARADGRRRRQPARADRGDRAREEGSARARSPRCRRWSPLDFDNVEAARQLAELLQAGGHRRSGAARAGLRADRRHRSVRRRRARHARPLRDAAERCRRPRRASSARSRARARSTRRRPTPISPRAISRAASGPKRKKQTLAALEIAPSYERAQDLLLKLVGGPAVNGAARRVAARLAARRAGVLLVARAGRSSRRCDAQLPAVADDRFAGLQWRFVRIKYHYMTEGTRVAAGFLRRAVGHRRAGRRAEPVAPRQDRDRDPGRGSDRR